VPGHRSLVTIYEGNMTDPNAKTPDPLPWLEEMPPRQIVAELDRYIIGQGAAKKAVAIAIRNRWRRMQTPEAIRDEITPYNIIMIGPTGVGKTEVARRLARLAGAPFLKVEASKFTEVGYVGRDVESMIRELVDVAITMVRTEREDDVWPQAEEKAESRLLDLLLPAPPDAGAGTQGRSGADEGEAEKARRTKAREKLQVELKEGKLDDREVEVELAPQSYPNPDWGGPPEGSQDPGFNMGEWLQEMLPKRKKRRTVKVPDARRIILDEELRRMVDMDDVVNESLDRVENHGIVFIDEIDKIAGERSTTGPDISREGVQRDLLPIVEGSTVQTRYGYIRTDHILFIAAGAFHVSKPSDLIPELQGRFPIRVELTPLTEDDFVRIMTEPENSLTKQYQALVTAEGSTLEFTTEGIREIARLAWQANDRMENIGARRLHTVMSTLMEETLFELPEGGVRTIVLTEELVKSKLKAIIENDDLRRYIL
jgi:ATP-dependent HslUV protease ATP-binding subunit HslU